MDIPKQKKVSAQMVAGQDQAGREVDGTDLQRVGAGYQDFLGPESD